MPRFNANITTMFNEVSFVERFAAARRCGFEAIEFQFPYEHRKDLLAEVAEREGLQVILFNMPRGNRGVGDQGMACDPARVIEFQESVGAAAQYALALKCTRLHCMAGIKPPGVSVDKIRRTYIENLRFAGSELDKYGITLLIEAINSRDMPGFYLTTSAQALDLMREARLRNLQFLYDIYHMQIMEGNLAPTIENNLDIIGHMQLADTPGRHEPWTGEINWSFLFRHIDGIGYTGWIGCEYRPAGITEAGLRWREGL